MTGFLSRMAGVASLLVLISGCSLSDMGLGGKQEPSNASSGPQFPNIDNGAASASGAAAPAQPANVSEIAKVYFAPIVGAPVDLMATLSRRLIVVGRANGVESVPASTPGLTHELKGYFSAFSENGKTTVIHVWDVVAPNGQRVHRIQGQEVIPGAAPDPWSSVTPAAMESIANTVMSQYVTWLKSGA